MRHMMIDLETLATTPDAVVFQIGFAVFDKDGNVFDSVRMEIDILPQIMKGRKVDPETQRWWAQQLESSWYRHFDNQISLDHAFATIKRHFVSRECRHVWANSPSFDCVILESLAGQFNLELPWNFRQQMDVRTLKTLGRIMEVPRLDPEPATHDSREDCLRQIREVSHYWRMLEK